MLLSIGTAIALIPLGVYAYRDLSYKFGIPEEIELPERIHHGWAVPVGVDEHREEYTINFTATPHLVLGGATRYGKSNMLNSLIVSLIRSRPDSVSFTLIDLKGGLEFGKWEPLKQCLGYAEEPDHALKVLTEAYNLMRKEQERLKAKGKRKQSHKKHFVIIDEVGELNPSEAVSKEERNLKRECQSLMSKISRLGAGLGFHLILATQYPTGDVLPRQCKQNSDSKICFRVQSGVASKVVLDEVGAEELPDIRGRCILQRGADRYTLQTYLVSEETIDDIVKCHTLKRCIITEEVITNETTQQPSRKNTLIIKETKFSDEDATF